MTGTLENRRFWLPFSPALTRERLKMLGIFNPCLSQLWKEPGSLLLLGFKDEIGIVSAQGASGQLSRMWLIWSYLRYWRATECPHGKSAR
jgi:hypothetical protein